MVFNAARGVYEEDEMFRRFDALERSHKASHQDAARMTLNKPIWTSMMELPSYERGGAGACAPEQYGSLLVTIRSSLWLRPGYLQQETLNEPCVDWTS